MKVELSCLQFGELSIEQFLTRYWQKKPLLIRNALPGFTSPITPDELAGLACDEAIESRLVIEKGGATAWEVRHGPFTQQDFESLPESHWTLLVQDAEKHIPELYDLIQAFRFIPDWRIDDLMISYATKHGSVGPHTDAYDVFLLQGLGDRLWQINTQPVSENNIIENLELCVMKEFKAEQEWTLEPGDMLYLPPNVAHYGTALTECMTYSIGFRSPGNIELLHSFLDHMLNEAIENKNTGKTYSDPNLIQQNDPACIASESMDKLRNVIQALLPKSNNKINHWLGKYLSEPKEHLSIQSANEPLNRTDFIRKWQGNNYILRNTAARILYILENEQCIIFASGCKYSIPVKYQKGISILCRTRKVHFKSLHQWLEDDVFSGLLCQFYNQGYLYFESEPAHE